VRRALLTIVTGIELFLVATLGFLVVLAVYLTTRWFDPRRLVSGRALRRVAKAAATFNPFWRFEVLGPVPSTRPGRVVCVSNHLSYADIFLISHLPWEMKWLSKTSIFYIPCVGWGMWLVGDIGIDRASAHSARSALDRAASWLERDVPVMIFPEGTRSASGELLPFKDGAFRLAIETAADVLPIAVWGTQTALPKKNFPPGPARGLVCVGEPISTAGMTVTDVRRLKDATRARILELQHGLRAQHASGAR
jgi:1-acyl-sn-glycerol-3-phosphate acyltransferase